MLKLLENSKRISFFRNQFCYLSYFIQNFKKSSNYSTTTTTISDHQQSSPKIVIIGAGLSGLSAAEHLTKNGFDNIEILEASNRYGGRIHTQQFGDAICELGAKWFFKNNSSKSFYDLLRNTNNSIDDNDSNDKIRKFSNFHEKYFLTSTGEKLDPEIVLKVSHAFNNILKNSNYLKNTILIDRFNNSKIYLEIETEKCAKSLFKKDSYEACKIFNSLIYDFSSFFGCDLSRVHVYQLSKISPFYKNLITFPNGLINILKPLIDNIDENQIKYEKPVSNIKWSRINPNKKIRVYCLDQSQIEADHVICTLPLGSLKTFSSLLFDPMLPAFKSSAMLNLGISSPGQFYLHYSDDIKSWYHFNGSIKPAWSSLEIGNINDILSRDITEISLLPNSSHVLEVKRIGDEDFERLNQSDIIEKITMMLRKFMKNNDIPYPNDIIESKWGTDTKFLGGLPFLNKPNSEKFIYNLSVPCGPVAINSDGSIDRIIPKLLFAGDATDWDGFATLDGARRSGIREAQRLIDFYKFQQ